MLFINRITGILFNPKPSNYSNYLIFLFKQLDIYTEKSELFIFYIHYAKLSRKLNWNQCFENRTGY